MQRPRLTKTGGAAAAAEFELEQRTVAQGGRRVAEGPSGRAIYKGELISGREKRGDRGVVISP